MDNNKKINDIRKILIKEINKFKYIEHLEFIYIYLKEIEKKQRK